MLIPGPEQSIPSVIEALRSATCSHHARLASNPAMVRLFARDYTVAEYRAHLGCMLGLFEPLERMVSQAAGANRSLSALERSKDLYDDLSIMGSSADEIDAFERCPYVPSVPTAGLRGYLYVMLGSMLGGEIIVRRLRSVFGDNASYLFYGGSEPQNYESHWASFCSDIEERGKEDVYTICATAVEILDLYEAWLSEPRQRPGRLC
jgi:heme oxygenase